MGDKTGTGGFDMTATLSPVELPEIMLPREAARYLRISEDVLQNWRNQGIGPTYCKRSLSTQAHVYYLREDLADWVATWPRFIGSVEANVEAAHGRL